MSNCVAVHSPADMCRLLRDTCLDQAADFARVQHETACHGHAEDRLAFWQEVVSLLAGPAEPRAVPADAA